MRYRSKVGRSATQLTAGTVPAIVHYIVKYYDDSLSLTFGALTDPTRRTILSLLRRHPCSVSEVAEQLPFKLPGVTKHLDVLERAELIDRAKVGRVVTVTLAPTPLRQATAWLARYDAFWSGSLDKLQRHLERGR